MTDPIAEARLRQILGPRGAEALTDSLIALAQAHPDLDGVEIVWAGWSRSDWSFTLAVDGGRRRFSIALPHAAGEVVIRELEHGGDDAA